MSDYYGIQQVGGTELAQRYPDRGLIADAKWHNVVLTAGTKASGWRRLFRKSERFLAVLSANTHGLRLLVSLDNFAVFIPWSEVSVLAERSRPGTVVRLQTAATPAVDLEFHLDDDAADALFSKVMPALPRRDPPGRLFWPKPWALGVLLFVTVAGGVLLGCLELSWIARVVAGVSLAAAISSLWFACRPMLEEDR